MKRILSLAVIIVALSMSSAFAKEVSLIKLANLIITNSDLNAVSGDDYLYHRAISSDDKAIQLRLQIGNWDERFKHEIDYALEMKLSSEIINLDIDWRIIHFLNGKVVILTNTNQEIMANDAEELRYVRSWFKLFDI